MTEAKNPTIVACPTGDSPTQAPASLDVVVVAILGLLGGSLAAAVSIRNLRGTETPYDVPLVDRMVEALLAEDPSARVLPYCLSGGTDNKSFSQLGIPGYGFAPLRLPADLDFTALFHGVDERVPVDALEFGARVFDRFLDDV